MTLLKSTITALVAAGAAYAQCNGNPDLTIQSSGDASKLSSCSTFTGNIVIDSQLGDQVNLGGIKKLDGDLRIDGNSKITSIGADSLEEITGQFKLNEVQVLNSVNFPKLSSVDTIMWNALPNLQQLSFTSQVKTAKTVNIQNTQLNDLKGVNLMTVDNFYIANNPYLEKMDLQLNNVGTSLILEANSPKLNVQFSNLEWAFNMTFRNCSSISVPSLESLNGSMGLYGNGIQSFSGPNLTTVGGTLSFVSNVELTNISLPQLKEVKGGFQVANNTKLGKIDGFGALETVGGALDFNGNFTQVDLPQLKDVRGAFNMQSSGDISSACDHFKSISGQNNAIKGKFVCAGNVDKPGGAGSNPTSSGNGPDATGAAVKVGSSAAMTGLSAVFAALLALY